MGVNGFGYRVSGGQAESVPIEAALTCCDALVWVHLNSTEDDASAWLSEQAKLDAHVVEALTATETRPRCEEFAAGALVNLRGRAKEEQSQSDPLASVRIWATKGRVFTVSRQHLHATDTVAAAVAAGTVQDPGDLIAAYATAITTDLDPVVAELGDSLDDCEEQLSADRIFDLRRNVSKVRVQAIGYRRFLNPQRDALERLGSLQGDWLEADDRVHLAAAADRAARMAEELESIRERSAVVHDALSDLRAEQLDSRGLVISIVAMMFLPLTFVTGFYGMNVKLPGADSPYAWMWVAVICFLIVLIVLGFFTRRHWFKG